MTPRGARVMSYEHVNGAWPVAQNLLPPLTAQEAVSAARRLYRLAMKQSFKGKVKITSGRNYTYIRYGVLRVNPERGWWILVHGLSHHCSRRLFPGSKPHDHQHAFLEKTLIEHVVNSGWLDGKLKRPEKPKPEIDVRVVRHQRIAARMERWEAKRKRAEQALKKLRRQNSYYERARASLDQAEHV